MKNKIYLVLLISAAAHFACAATITVTGPTVVCPSTQYSYTASASTILGAQKGCFFFTFLVNGTAVGYAGGITCPCARQSSTYTANFTWPATQGNFQINVSFTPFNLLPCPSYSYGSLSGYVRVVVPEVMFDANGGLSFCSSGQTRTVSVPNVPYNSPNYCNWHHKYDWIVPNGWSVTPITTGEPFTVIPGGIRTLATSVNVTAPSTALSPGFTGNYFVTVRTEPAWQWPKQITRQIWVGTYGSSLTIAGTSAVCPGNIYTYTATPPGGQQAYGQSYSWTKPSNWTVQSQAVNYITLQLPQYNPDYGPVQVSVNNGCGTTVNGITAFPGYGCGSYLMNIFPNPVQEELTIEMTATDAALNSQELPKISEVRLVNFDGETVRSSNKVDGAVKLNVRGLKKGQYFLHVRIGDQITKEQIVIN